METNNNKVVNAKINSRYSQPEQIDLLELFFILLKKWKLIVVTTLVAMLGFGIIYNFVAEQKYSASIKVYVNANNLSVSQSISLSTIDASSSLVPIYGEILNTHLVLDKVGSRLASQGYSDLDYYNLSEMITYEALSDTPVFEITVEDNDPKRAIAIANTIADVLPDQIAGIIDGSSARIVDNALSASYLSRGVLKNTILAGMVGFIFICGFILMVDYFMNDTIRDPKFLEDFGDYPILGRVPDAETVTKKKKTIKSYKQYGSRELTENMLTKDIKTKRIEQGGRK